MNEEPKRIFVVGPNDIYKLRKINLTLDKAIDRAESLGIGHRVCQQIETGERYDEYDIGQILRVEEVTQKEIENNPLFQLPSRLMVLGIYFEKLRENVKNYFGNTF